MDVQRRKGVKGPAARLAGGPVAPLKDLLIILLPAPALSPVPVDTS